MEQLVATNRQNAEHAREATRLATEALQAAHKGDGATARMLTTMNDIMDSRLSRSKRKANFGLTGSGRTAKSCLRMRDSKTEKRGQYSCICRSCTPYAEMPACDFIA